MKGLSDGQKEAQFPPLFQGSILKGARRFESTSLRHPVPDLGHSPQRWAKSTRVRAFIAFKGDWRNAKCRYRRGCGLISLRPPLSRCALRPSETRFGFSGRVPEIPAVYPAT